ncbi:MAG: SMC-Scp complex subunit ScpB [OM182 bacterium MED-G24]|uniref:SMC-Scp complex subunit ScpB n=1 Tax=OM182 bacterium MED-G24 TaxID=1986255 RepID=A0A2A5WUB5_9GAMM|nr:MAG: SMC-Scp complex subunit ScpB [OM182 bacterium MED-G24]
MQHSLLKQIIEGAILAADTPLSVDRIMSLIEGGEVGQDGEDVPSRSDVREVLDEIANDCAERGFELRKVATGYRFQVRSELGEWVGNLWEERPPRYTRALLETLALIAYKQPITRGDIEEIRGVAVSTNIIRTLLDREWIRVVGQRDVPGKPSLFATTREFLDYFNLASLEELPTLAEIRDLDTVNQQLDLEDEIIPPRTLDVSDRKQDEKSETSEEIERSGMSEGEGPGVSDDAVSDAATKVDADEKEQATSIDGVDLDAVTDRVNQIQDNIRRLYEQPDQDDENENGDEDGNGERKGDQGEGRGETSLDESPDRRDVDDSGPQDTGEESGPVTGNTVDGQPTDTVLSDDDRQDGGTLGQGDIAPADDDEDPPDEDQDQRG